MDRRWAMGAQAWFPHFIFHFNPVSAALFVVQIFEKLFLPASAIFLVSFFDQIFLHFCPSSIPLWIFHLVFHVSFLLFFSLYATLLHLAFVLSLILGLVLGFLLSFSSRPLFPSLNMLFLFLPGHLAFSSSPPMVCYNISWVGKCNSVPCCALIYRPPQKLCWSGLVLLLPSAMERLIFHVAGLVWNITFLCCVTAVPRATWG